MPARKLSTQDRQNIIADFQERENHILEADNQFSKIPYAVTLKAVDARLSAPAYRLWLYLFGNFPFGDREYELPLQSELAIRLGVSRQTINSAAAEIQDAGLWDFTIKKWKGRNLFGHGSPLVAQLVTPQPTPRCNELVTPQPTPRCQKSATPKISVSPKAIPRCQKSATPCQKSATPCQKLATPCPELVTPETPECLSDKDYGSIQTIQTFKSSSDLPGEEDFKFQEKEEEVEQASQALVGPLVESNQLASDTPPVPLSNKAEIVEEPIASGVDNSSAPVDEVDKDFLLWVMEVKIPTMKLREQPINVEAYARGMIRRDGEKLRADYAVVVAQAEFAKKIVDLTIQVEQRVAEWQKVSHAKLTVYHDLEEGMPMVLLDGIEIGAVDFLAKPIQHAPMVCTTPFNEEVRALRPSRQSRLKLAAKLNECPEFEFLQACWDDLYLRNQLALILDKHPDWASVKDNRLVPGD